LPANQHVFAEGSDNQLRLVGDFNALYTEVADPWGQSAQGGTDMDRYYAFSRARVVAAARNSTQEIPYRGLEIGCGHGHVVDTLRHSCYYPWFGIDVSPVAVETARRLYPQSTFFVEDITADWNPREMPGVLGQYNVVLLGQMLWYILPKLDAALARCATLTAPGGTFIISQAFLREQRYGRDIVDGFDGLVRLLLNRWADVFRLIEARYDDSETYCHHDGIVVLRRLA